MEQMRDICRGSVELLERTQGSAKNHMLFIVSKQCACSRRVHIEGHMNIFEFLLSWTIIPHSMLNKFFWSFHTGFTWSLKRYCPTTIVIFSYPKLLSFSVLTFKKWRLNTELLAKINKIVINWKIKWSPYFFLLCA
jgi:hypothetical protein